MEILNQQDDSNSHESLVTTLFASVWLRYDIRQAPHLFEITGLSKFQRPYDTFPVLLSIVFAEG